MVNCKNCKNTEICQRDIDTVYRAADSWGVRFKPDKCAILRCHRSSRNVNPDPPHCYVMNTTTLSIETSHRDLGIIVDCHLKFHPHISSTVKKAAGLANNLLRSTLCRDKDFMITLFKSHIRPLLEFGSTVWNTRYVCDATKVDQTNQGNG